jgi:tetratricopeptide (TPR) repeat protein
MIAQLLAAALCGLSQEGTWEALWTEAERLRAGGLPSAEADARRSRLAEAVRDSADGPRRELLALVLEASAGRDASSLALRLARLRPSPFTSREQWLLADLLPPGAERVQAVLVALEAPAVLSRWQFLLAWNTAVDEARNLRLAESSLPIQHELHRRYQAEWSALDLALTYKSLGDRVAVERILAEAIRSEEAAGRRPRDLWEFRGIAALGFGDEQRARDYWGRAVMLGSAGAELSLARMDNGRGQTELARRSFRSLVHARPTQDWAWRGWGTTLLPAFLPEVSPDTPLTQ